MLDWKAPSSQLALAEYAKDPVRSSIHRYAAWRAGDPDAGKDLAADALRLVCDPDRKPWDPAKGSLFRHYRMVMDDLVVERARTGAGRFEIPLSRLPASEGEAATVPEKPSSDPVPEEALSTALERDILLRTGERLRASLVGKDDTAVAVYDAACVHDEPADQARALGIPVEEVYEAHRRLKYQGAKLLELVRKEEAQMMFTRRLRAMKKKDPS